MAWSPPRFSCRVHRVEDVLRLPVLRREVEVADEVRARVVVCCTGKSRSTRNEPGNVREPTGGARWGRRRCRRIGAGCNRKTGGVDGIVQETRIPSAVYWHYYRFRDRHRGKLPRNEESAFSSDSTLFLSVVDRD